MDRKLLNLGLAGILTLSSNCALFHRTKIEEVKPEIVKQEPIQESTYKEKILHVRDYLQNNQEGDRNIHTFQFENKTVYVSLPVKKELKGRNDLLYLEVVQNNNSFLYAHLPENEYPDAVIEGSPGILSYLFDVYDARGNLEASIWWNYKVHQPPKQEQIQEYKLVIDELAKKIKENQ